VRLHRGHHCPRSPPCPPRDASLRSKQPARRPAGAVELPSRLPEPHMRRPLLTLPALLLPTLLLAADFKPRPFDWPQWQGPDRTAVSKEPGLLRSWPKEGPKLLWEAKGLGDGSFGPSFGQERSRDRKSTRLNSSHVKISYAVFC